MPGPYITVRAVMLLLVDVGAIRGEGLGLAADPASGRDPTLEQDALAYVEGEAGATIDNYITIDAVESTELAPWDEPKLWRLTCLLCGTEHQHLIPAQEHLRDAHVAKRYPGDLDYVWRTLLRTQTHYAAGPGRIVYAIGGQDTPEANAPWLLAEGDPGPEETRRARLRRTLRPDLHGLPSPEAVRPSQEEKH